jgi:hypothetical protein
MAHKGKYYPCWNPSRLFGFGQNWPILPPTEWGYHVTAWSGDWGSYFEVLGREIYGQNLEDGRYSTQLPWTGEYTVFGGLPWYMYVLWEVGPDWHDYTDGSWSIIGNIGGGEQWAWFGGQATIGDTQFSVQWSEAVGSIYNHFGDTWGCPDGIEVFSLNWGYDPQPPLSWPW